MFRFCCRLTLFSSLVSCGFASGQEPPGGAAPRKSGDTAPLVTGKDAPDKALTAEATAFFEKRIRPVLVAECYGCHSPERVKKVKGGLALDTVEGLRKGGKSGAVIVPGSPAQSLLIKALGHGDPTLAMPPKKKLDA